MHLIIIFFIKNKHTQNKIAEYHHVVKGVSVTMAEMSHKQTARKILNQTVQSGLQITIFSRE